MIRPLKFYAVFCFVVCLIFLGEQLWEWFHDKATSTSILTFLGVLFGAGAAFMWKYSEALIDEDKDGKSDKLKEGRSNGKPF